MKKIDVKEEMNAYFGHLADVEHLIGVAKFENPDVSIAMARLLFSEDCPPPTWPEKLIYRCAVDVGSTVRMFVICEPGQFLKPFVATEWYDDYQAFIDAAEAANMFMVEIITPKHRYGAAFIDGKINDSVVQDITLEQFEAFCNSYKSRSRVQS